MMITGWVLEGSEVKILGLFSGADLARLAYFNPPSLFGWVLVALLGVSGIYFQIYMTRAYAASRKAGIVAAISYSDILFSMALGIMLGDHLPGPIVLAGIAVVILSGILIARAR